jgi:O-antigen/teichoic acid export membrane protein
VFRVVLAVNCAFAAAAVLLAAPLVGRLMGPAWTAMVPLVRILGVATVFRSVIVTAGDLVCAIDRPALATRVNLVRVGVMAATLGPLLLAFGAAGVAGAVLVSGAAAAAVSLVQVRAATGLTPLNLLRPRGPVRVDDARAAAACTARAG